MIRPVWKSFVIAEKLWTTVQSILVNGSRDISSTFLVERKIASL
jgi:hypothetical protein